MTSPAQPPFLAAVPGDPTPDADAIIFGVPADGDVSFRSGAADGPVGIRVFSDSIETWSQRVRRDLEDLAIIDAGDNAAPDWTSVPTGPLWCTFGGDHAVTPAIVHARAAAHPDLIVLQYDAHLDLRHEYHGAHACAMWNIVSRGVPVVSLGVRSGERPEWQDADRYLLHWSHSVEMTGHVRGLLSGRPVYVTVDIDVLDPSVAPGTGTPEAGGATFTQLLESIEALQGMNVVAFDIVEVAPPLDPSGITQAAAALLAREMILRFA